MSLLKLNNIKQRNLASALRHFCDNEGISRREAAELMQCDHATATRAVKSLLDMEFLIPAGKKETPHGRPREMLTLHPNSPRTIGVEISEQRISGVVSDLSGRILYRASAEIMPGGKLPEFKRAFVQCVNQLSDYAGARLYGIAVATIGSFGSGGTVIRECANYPELNGLDLEQFWQDNFSSAVPYFTDRLLAEMHWFLAAEPELKNNTCLLIDAGSGIGMAMAYNGAIVSLQRRHGGELGHNTVIPGGELCRCGRSGCLEAYASTSRLISITGSCSWAEVIEKHSTDDAVLKAAELFGLTLANQINNLMPDHVVIAGELVMLGESVSDTIRQTAMRNLFSAAGNPEIVFQPGAPDAAAGAALLAREDFFCRFAAGELEAGHENSEKAF